MPENAKPIDWKSVAIIGEYTTASGPYIDDHFLLVVLHSGRMLEYASKSADFIIPDLERVLGIKIEFRLSNRTDAASRVIFPPSFLEHPLFDFYEGPNGFFHFFKFIRNFGMTKTSMRLTKELTEYLEALRITQPKGEDMSTDLI